MSAYRCVVVGTDGSESSMRAVDRAAELAGACQARLVVALAHQPRTVDEGTAADARAALGSEAHLALGAAPGEDAVRRAGDRARAAGARSVDTVAAVGAPVEALLDIVRREDADLLVVGNRGLSGLRGRLLGSVPADVTRRATVDVLVVHTTD
ncbi:universal stress protein [Modestobacter sp. VKM Ac-2984]|nr:universal stress protein [Modestobacter sp. VKM Ac-2984]MCZ2816554.1 universal stress protein [Modestobacter sp. VKM Ac-2984]